MAFYWDNVIGTLYLSQTLLFFFEKKNTMMPFVYHYNILQALIFKKKSYHVSFIYHLNIESEDVIKGYSSLFLLKKWAN